MALNRLDLGLLYWKGLGMNFTYIVNNMLSFLGLFGLVIFFWRYWIKIFLYLLIKAKLTHKDYTLSLYSNFHIITRWRL